MSSDEGYIYSFGVDEEENVPPSAPSYKEALPPQSDANARGGRQRALPASVKSKAPDVVQTSAGREDQVSLSIAQSKVINRLIARKSTFFTGAAGTGKSYCVTVLQEILKKLGMLDKLALTAPTGVAACNISGMTIHSWSGVGLGVKSATDLANTIMSKKSGPYGSEVLHRWQTTEILVIDEVSMLSSELFEKISDVGKRVRKDRRPFGGLQVILCGDFFQLPPVGKSDKFCFNSPVWHELLGSDGSIVLDQVFRQKDGPFVRLLNDMRRGVVSPEANTILQQKMHETQIFMSRSEETRRTMQSQAMAAGSTPSAAVDLTTPQSQPARTEMKHTCLFSRNADCDLHNERELLKLKLVNVNHEHVNISEDEGRKFIYTAIDESKQGAREMLKNFKAPPELELRVGAQVMLVKNLDQDRGLVNGSRGVVTRFVDVDADDPSVRYNFNGQPLPEVKFHVVRGGHEEIITEIMQAKAFEVTAGDIVIASRKQIPLMLAWAVSIHKSQGLTIPYLNVSFEGIFECGQAYVALSRATDLPGLLLRKYSSHVVRAHPDVKKFYTDMGCDLDTSEQHATELVVTSIAELSQRFAVALPTAAAATDADEWLDADSSGLNRGGLKRKNTMPAPVSAADIAGDKRAKMGKSPTIPGREQSRRQPDNESSLHAGRQVGNVFSIFASTQASQSQSAMKGHGQDQERGRGLEDGRGGASMYPVKSDVASRPAGHASSAAAGTARTLGDFGCGGSLSGIAAHALKQPMHSNASRSGTPGVQYLSALSSGSYVQSQDRNSHLAHRPDVAPRPYHNGTNQYQQAYPSAQSSALPVRGPMIPAAPVAAPAPAPAASSQGGTTLSDEQRLLIQRNKEEAMRRRTAALAAKSRLENERGSSGNGSGAVDEVPPSELQSLFRRLV